MTEPTARTCPWCSATAAPGATSCVSCGASLAQRESIGDLALPGVTSVDAALQALDARPIHLRPGSPSQGVAAGVIPAVAIGGPVGLAALGGIAAVAAGEYLGASVGDHGEAVDPASVGDPSEAARLAVERLERGEELGEPGATAETRPTPAPEESAVDPWRDLPNG